MAAPDAAARLHEAVSRLHQTAPTLSAARRLSRGQALTFAAATFATGLLLIELPRQTLVGLVTLATVVYAVNLGYRASLLRRTLDHSSVITVTDREARSIPGRELPRYTILVPAYHESDVIGELLAALARLDYPKTKLEIKLLLEADDAETLEALAATRLPRHVQVVLVPPAEPRTKPKALNYGVSFATGEYLTIFDVEDRPEPLQLRRAVAAFRRLGSSVSCLQAVLSYHNAEQNMITRWFTLEYALWFSYFLPSLARGRAPIPLGGTSNHIRRSALEEVGCWDPFNVTEDADLGVRLHRAGHGVSVLASTTFEEANSDFVNWVKQRSRWYKGYFQTWLVHMRHPGRLRSELGTRGFLGFNLFVGGTPWLALINPVFWLLTLMWFIGKPGFVNLLFPGPIYYLALLCWVFGNFAIVYGNVLAARAVGLPHLLLPALLSPLYWIMMSLAAVKAAIQLIATPSFWEKTVHGLAAPPKEVVTHAAS